LLELLRFFGLNKSSPYNETIVSIIIKSLG
jgi:hypothetical protein